MQKTKVKGHTRQGRPVKGHSRVVEGLKTAGLALGTGAAALGAGYGARKLLLKNAPAIKRSLANTYTKALLQEKRKFEAQINAGQKYPLSVDPTGFRQFYQLMVNKTPVQLYQMERATRPLFQGHMPPNKFYDELIKLTPTQQKAVYLQLKMRNPATARSLRREIYSIYRDRAGLGKTEASLGNLVSSHNEKLASLRRRVETGEDSPELYRKAVQKLEENLEKRKREIAPNLGKSRKDQIADLKKVLHFSSSFLVDFAEFARPRGARDKSPRRRRTLSDNLLGTTTQGRIIRGAGLAGTLLGLRLGRKGIGPLSRRIKKAKSKTTSGSTQPTRILGYLKEGRR